MRAFLVGFAFCCLSGVSLGQTGNLRIDATTSTRHSTCEIRLRFQNGFHSFSFVNNFAIELEINNARRSVVRFVTFRSVEQWGTRDETIYLSDRCEQDLSLRVMSVEVCEADRRRYSDCADFLSVSHPVSLRPGLASRPPPWSSPAPTPVRVAVQRTSIDAEGHARATLRLTSTGREGAYDSMLDCRFLDAAGAGVGIYYAARQLSFSGGVVTVEIRSPLPAAGALSTECIAR